jgi:hypothetical protein
MLTSEEVKGKIQHFFDERFYKRVKLSFSEVRLLGEVYYAEGRVDIPSGDPVMGYLFRHPEKYTFKVQLDTEKGRMISWELR